MTQNPPDDIRSDEILYADVRRTIQDGDIVLFQGQDWGSRIIRFVTRSSYSHAGLCGWWNGRLLVMEARRFGVRAARLSHIVRRYHGGAELWCVREGVPVTDAQRVRIVELAKNELGKNYSWRKVLGYWRRLYANLLGGPVRRRAVRQAELSGSPEDFFCSEYVSYAWRTGASFALCGQMDHFTTPEDLAASKHLERRGRLV